VQTLKFHKMEIGESPKVTSYSLLDNILLIFDTESKLWAYDLEKECSVTFFKVAESEYCYSLSDFEDTPWVA